jgi:phage-related protein
MGIEIHRAALKAMQKFPSTALVQAKEAFAFLESGEKLSLPMSRPMPAIWSGCHELRIGDKQGIYRIFYVIVLKGTIFIPHCFHKKTQKTPQAEINLTQRRIKEYLSGR